MYFLVKFRHYISDFDKVTALLISWEFDRKIDGEFHNDVIRRSRDLLIILVLLKKLGKYISSTYLITFLCNFTQIEVIGINFGCRTKLSPLIKSV